jgi:hypothetical protein
MEFSQICYSSCHFFIEMPFAKLRILLVLHDPVSIEPYFVFVRLEGTPEDLDQDVEEVQALVIIDTLRCLV